jgi:hypothetical protein
MNMAFKKDICFLPVSHAMSGSTPGASSRPASAAVACACRVSGGGAGCTGGGSAATGSVAAVSSTAASKRFAAL